jgi:hypothetical protein
MSTDLQFDERATCERCGRFGAYLFDGEALCAECYETRGSCCPEFGADDLWSCEQRSAPVKTAPHEQARPADSPTPDPG